jgi:hypothetical protein
MIPGIDRASSRYVPATAHAPIYFLHALFVRASHVASTKSVQALPHLFPCCMHYLLKPLATLYAMFVRD